jgi:hypothetical protein
VHKVTLLILPLAGAGLGAYARSELAPRLQIEYVRALEVEPNGQFVANPTTPNDWERDAWLGPRDLNVICHSTSFQTVLL